MDILTYNLKGKSVNSNAYYEKLKAVSNRIKNLLFDYGKIQIPLKKCWHNDIGQLWNQNIIIFNGSAVYKYSINRSIWNV